MVYYRLNIYNFIYTQESVINKTLRQEKSKLNVIFQNNFLKKSFENVKLKYLKFNKYEQSVWRVKSSRRCSYHVHFTLFGGTYYFLL